MTLGAPALQEPGEYQWLVTRRDIEDTPKYLDVADFRYRESSQRFRSSRRLHDDRRWSAYTERRCVQFG